ncbi:Cytochrome P450 [Haladaptatus litoreus]|uniref:Cytochrome P450 n=1 Tax=Haladaptatus litoreus TaxID=553468 RepID=A0A1N6V1I8_9EURY|nr:cytochrome P450 [Haladaptatus litoreus]SIQ71672.1 Cytochrome P450 [Haladaptatus litoreus]
MTTSEATTSDQLDDLPLPPGPNSYPVVGNTLGFLRDPFEFYDSLGDYGDVVSYSVAGEDFCTLLHPDYVEQVLVTEESKFGKSEFVQDAGERFIGNGLFASEGEFWRRQRTLIQPAFYRERITSYTEPMVDFAASAAKSWNDGETIRIDEAMKRLTLRILSKTLFDLDIRNQQSAIRDAVQAINDKGDASSVDAFLPDWVPTATNRRFRRATDDFDDVIETLIQKRRGEPPGDDFLSILMHATDEHGEGMSDEALRDEMATFLFAGHETTVLALTYCWYLLSEHSEVREKLNHELDSVLDGDTPTMADIEKLEYTDEVVREALRLYPPAYVVFRQTKEDVEIGGYRVPAGTTLTLPLFVIHTDDRWYDDPEQFRPERWTTEFEDSLPDYAYFPFGGGPRHCIGMRFANTEIRLVLATIAQHVEFDCHTSDLDLRMGTTLEPTNGIEMTVKKR